MVNIRYVHNHVFFAILICLIVLLAGCGSSNKTETPPPVSQSARAVATQPAVQSIQPQPASATQSTESRSEGAPPPLVNATGPVEPPEVVVVSQGQVEPPDPYIYKNFPVPYGKRVWPKWRVTREITLYRDKELKSPMVSRIIPGDIMQVAGSELHAHPVKLLVTKDYTSRNGRRFSKGDVLYVLYRVEEDFYRVWHNGVEFYLNLTYVKGSEYYQPQYSEQAWGELQDNDKQNELWVELIGPEGQRGWTDLDKLSITWVR